MSDHVITQQMGITHRDFFRLLPTALGTDGFTVDGPTAVCEFDGKRVAISLGPEGERRIALLSIPTADVTITLSGFDEAEREKFMTTFDRAYQRGGG